MGDLGKPSLPKSLDSGAKVNGPPEKSSFSGYHAALSPPPICTSSSYEGESAHWRGKPREMGSWDSCVTMVNARSPHLNPSSANANEGMPSTCSPIFTSNAYTLTPHTTLIPSRLPHLDPPVSPKTIPAPPYYVSPVEPVKAAITDGAHRMAQTARQTSPLKSNYSAGEEKSDISRNDRQNRSSTSSGRSSVSSRKGILKTSPTYVARNSSQSLPYRPLLSSDGALTSTLAKEGLNGVLQPSSSATPLRGPISHQSASSDGACISNSGRRRRSGETKVLAQGKLNQGFYFPMHSSASASAIAVPISPSSSQESHIVNLGPDPNVACCGSSGALARRVTISIPSRSTIRPSWSAKLGSVASSRSNRTPPTSTSGDGMEAHESHPYRRGDY